MAEFLTQNAGVSWLILGAVLLFIEVSVTGGIGIFFAAFGAITVGCLLGLGLIPESVSLISQIGFMFVFTGFWAAVLWKPLKNFQRGKNAPSYNDMIGSVATVKGELLKGKKGTVRWSGTDMNARLDKKNTTDAVQDGEEVTIIAVKGNVVTVKQ